ncbi:MAG TPA: hypothetical protein VFX22_00810 [Candidatus Kapabacteria bacterium]|nr:hypothetical protein [Candidatus Kapabacteria bacterium]
MKKFIFNVIARRNRIGDSRFCFDEAIRRIQPRGLTSTDCFVAFDSLRSSNTPRNDGTIIFYNF